MSTLQMVGLCWGLMFAADFLMEIPWTRMGMYTYPGTIPSLTLSSGHYYQLPIYEPLFWGSAWTAFACLRYFKNDRGETLAERGISSLKGGAGRKLFIRYLAFVGAGFMAFGLLYDIPTLLVSMKVGPWPTDVQQRSYLTDGLCGPDTDYACPGPNVPIPRTDSAHLDPRGELVIPPGARADDGRVQVDTETRFGGK